MSSLQALIRLVILMVGLSVAALDSADAQTISYSAVPAFGSDDDLFGTVTGVVPADHRVLVYIFLPADQRWWPKPSALGALIPIQADGSWSADITTHFTDPFASRIAAFLIPATYSPPSVSGEWYLPEEIEANALDHVEVYRTGNALQFAGYEWDLKDSGASLAGPGPNYFGGGSENVWVDGDGKLHLRITEDAGKWTCPELILREHSGYGTYQFSIETPINTFDANVVFGFFTWEHGDRDPANREIDIEIAQWGNPSDPTHAQFVVQPHGIAGHLRRIGIPDNVATTHRFEWSPDQVHFEIRSGASTLIDEWTFTGAAVPEPLFEQLRINLWLHQGLPPLNAQEFEVVISDFQFTPPPLPVAMIESIIRMPDGSVEVQIKGEADRLYRLEYSLNLEDWFPVVSQTAEGTSLLLTDLNSPPPVDGNKFYHVVTVE